MLVLGVLGSACGSAHYVRQEARSGAIGIAGPYMPSMREATTLMVEHCLGRYEVTSEDAEGAVLQYRCVDDRVSLR
jgi:hypothetical protein